MSTQVNDIRERYGKAVRSCQDKINWYQRIKSQHRFGYQTLQVTAIVLGALTPVLILWTDLKLLQALIAALAATATGLNSVFQWKESYIRFAYTGEALKSELLKFETRTTEAYRADLSNQQALDNFIARIDAIAMTEVSQWRTQMQSAPQPPTENK